MGKATGNAVLLKRPLPYSERERGKLSQSIQIQTVGRILPPSSRRADKTRAPYGGVSCYPPDTTSSAQAPEGAVAHSTEHC